MTALTLMVLVTLVLQRALELPGMPTWADLIILPMVWIVAPALLRHDRSWVYLSLLLGISWDLILNREVLGPGAIAWSVAALGLSVLAAVVADRSPKAWFAFGVAGTALWIAARGAALLPLGLRAPLSWHQLVVSILVTGVWCGLVGWIRALDPVLRWRSYRARKLR